MQQFLSAGLEQVFYAMDLDCFVVLEQDGDTLFLQSVVCKKKTAMKKILKRIIMKKETEKFARNISYRKTAPRYSGTCTRTTRYHNEGICEKHQNGSRVSELAEEYALSEKSIQRILRCTAADGKNTD